MDIIASLCRVVGRRPYEKTATAAGGLYIYLSIPLPRTRSRSVQMRDAD